jgi:predicted N-acetyltransferase YhbS
MNLKLRPGTAADAEACGAICYHAFKKLADEHSFPADLPSPEVASGLLSGLLSHPGFYAVVAEADGRVVGSNFLDERSVIAGIGPITIDSEVQNQRIGRTLMEDVLSRAKKGGFPGVRLLQATYHNRSLCLYAKLGFETRELISTMQGPPIQAEVPGYPVRTATAEDLEACSELCVRVHGHDRAGELADGVRQGTARVVEHHGRITGYSTAVAFLGHSVGETNNDLKALISAAPEFQGPGFQLPTRNGELFRWCMANGLRVVQPMTLMTIGLYNEPSGAYLPSVLY